MEIDDLNRSEAESLVRDLIGATERGEIKWVASNNPKADLFYIETLAGTVNVSSEQHGDHPYVFRIFNGDRKKLFELRSELGGFYTPGESELQRLYRTARDSVYDVRGTVREIRSVLDLD